AASVRSRVPSSTSCPDRIVGRSPRTVFRQSVGRILTPSLQPSLPASYRADAFGVRLGDYPSDRVDRMRRPNFLPCNGEPYRRQQRTRAIPTSAKVGHGWHMFESRRGAPFCRLARTSFVHLLTARPPQPDRSAVSDQHWSLQDQHAGFLQFLASRRLSALPLSDQRPRRVPLRPLSAYVSRFPHLRQLLAHRRWNEPQIRLLDHRQRRAALLRH